MNVLPGGSAAASSEVKVGDRITAVGQGDAGALIERLLGRRLDDVVQLIRGPENSVVRLQILPASASPGTQEAQIALTRSKITLESQAAKKEIHTIKRGDNDLKVGAIAVPASTRTSRAAARRAPRTTAPDPRRHRLVDEFKAQKIDRRGDGPPATTAADRCRRRSSRPASSSTGPGGAGARDRTAASRSSRAIPSPAWLGTVRSWC